MGSCLRKTAWRNLSLAIGLCLTGPLSAGEPPPAASPSEVARASQGARAPEESSAPSPFSWFASLAPGRETPMGAPQRRELLDSLLDHMRVHVSARLLERLTERPLEREFPVEETILGVSFSGRARSTSTMRVALAPDDDRAVFDVILTGVARSHTTGKAGPVCIQCQGVTRFTASKRFHVSDEGVTSLPVQCKADTSSTITDITSEWPGLRGRIAVRLAWRRSDETHTQAERISAERNQQRIAREFEEQMNRLAEKAERLLANEMLRGGSHAHPERRKFHFHTSRDYVCMASTGGDPHCLLPPEPKSDTLAKLWLPTAVIDLPLALAALQSAKLKRPEQLWRELTGRELAPLRWKSSAGAEAPLAVNVAVESDWLSLSMQPR